MAGAFYVFTLQQNDDAAQLRTWRPLLLQQNTSRRCRGGGKRHFCRDLQRQRVRLEGGAALQRHTQNLKLDEDCRREQRRKQHELLCRNLAHTLGSLN